MMTPRLGHRRGGMALSYAPRIARGPTYAIKVALSLGVIILVHPKRRKSASANAMSQCFVHGAVGKMKVSGLGKKKTLTWLSQKLQNPWKNKQIQQNANLAPG